MPSNRQWLIVKTVVLTLLAAGVTAGAAGVALLFSGWYDIAATSQHFSLVYSVLGKGLDYSVRHHAQDVALPPAGLGGEQQLRLGAQVYRDNCVQCHGAPAVAPASIGKSMQPLPGPLVAAAHHWKPRELYWITKHGIKMSGMPAWEYRLREDEIWAVVAFVTALPAMSPRDYQNVTAQGEPK